VINFAGGYASFTGTKFIGAGQVLVSSNAYFYGITASNLVLAGGTFTGQGYPGGGDLFGQILWTGGQFAGAVGVKNRADLRVVSGGVTGLAYGTDLQNYGTIQGAGVISSTNANDVSFENYGILCPGNPSGALNVEANVYARPAGTIKIKINGMQTNQFNSLIVGGSLLLGGTLQVSLESGLVAAVGTRFPIISSSNYSGTFSTLILPAGTSVDYGNTGVFLVVTVALPTQILFPHVSGTNFTFSFATASNQSYTVQTNTNMTATNWGFFTNLIGSGSPIQIAAPVINAPQMFFRVREP
jgi:hypothetical protein